MSLVGFKAGNHPQQTERRGARDDVDDRGTDQAFFDSLSERFGGFTLDVAAAEHNTKCERFYTLADDGLTQPWTGSVWVMLPTLPTIGSWVPLSLPVRSLTVGTPPWRSCETSGAAWPITPPASASACGERPEVNVPSAP